MKIILQLACYCSGLLKQITVGYFEVRYFMRDIKCQRKGYCREFYTVDGKREQKLEHTFYNTEMRKYQ